MINRTHRNEHSPSPPAAYHGACHRLNITAMERRARAKSLGACFSVDQCCWLWGPPSLLGHCGTKQDWATSGWPLCSSVHCPSWWGWSWRQRSPGSIAWFREPRDGSRTWRACRADAHDVAPRRHATAGLPEVTTHQEQRRALRDHPCTCERHRAVSSSIS